MTGVLLAALLFGANADVDAQVEKLRDASVPELIARGNASLGALGAYKVRATIQERLRGEMSEPRVLEMWVRETPRAVRVQFTGGPGKGRRAFYDAQVRRDDMRVRESGLLGVIGGVWVGVHSSMALHDTNHPITDVGLGAVLRIWEEDIDKAKAFGGLTRTDEGPNEKGRYCILYEAPSQATGLYATKSRLCLDPATALPLEITDWDKKGLFERFVFEQPEPHAAEAPGVLTAKAAGL